MLNFFKKNKSQEDKPAEILKETFEKEKLKLENEIIIHTMPERFRFAKLHLHVNKAQKTGLIILISGGIFLICLAGLLLYLFTKPAAKTVKNTDGQEQAAAPVAEEKIEPNIIATSSGNEEAIIPEPATTTATSTEENQAATSTSINYKSGEDKDSDGLTDKEERLIGSNPENADSDGDTYSDGSEIMNGFNPNGQGKLLDNPFVKKYENTTYKYSIFYPAVWELTSVGGDDSIFIRSQDNQFIQIIIQPNDEKLPIADWHKKQFNQELISEDNEISGNGWTGIKSVDGMVAYLTDNNFKNIYTLSYSTGQSETLEYIGLFNAMIKNLEIK